MNIRRMAAFYRTGLFDMAQITRIENHPFMAFFFCHSQGITKMAGGTADDRDIVSRIELFVLMATETHVNTAGAGHIKFFRAFYQLFTNNEPAERTEDSTNNEDFK
jgi:hypothetical protein